MDPAEQLLMAYDNSEHLRNPAGQLYLFLQHCEKAHSGSVIQTVWGAYFGSRDGITPQFATGYATVYELTEKVQAALMEWDSETESVRSAMFLSLMHPLREALVSSATSFGNAITFFRDAYAPGTSMAMQILSEAFNTRWRQTTGPHEDDIVALRQSVLDLYQEIHASPNMNPTLRLLLLDFVARMQRALELVLIGGMDALTDEIDLLRSRISRNPDLSEEVKQNPMLRDRILGVATVTNLVITLFNGSIMASDHVQELNNVLEAAVGHSEVVEAPNPSDIVSGSDREVPPETPVP